VIATLLLAGCASKGPAPVDGWDWKGPVPEGYYLVRQGDTLGGVAKRRRISSANLVRWNRLKSPYTLYAGRLLRVAPPGGKSAAPAKTSRGTAERPAKPKDGARPARVSTRPAPAEPGHPGSRAAASRVAWAWPLEGAIVRGYRGGDRTRQGLRLGCRPGDAVRAAAAGTVVYSGSGLKGYGNLIILRHNDKYLSAYGFNRRLLVTEGSGVRRGQAVAECGQGPDGVFLLHFEVRRDGAAVDPLLYLPPRI
jgi:lipoprotein NlpD